LQNIDKVSFPSFFDGLEGEQEFLSLLKPIFFNFSLFDDGLVQKMEFKVD
jgi:hypothetical protein